MPAYLIFVAVMLLMAFVSLGFSELLFYVDLGIALVSFIVVFVMMLSFKKYLRQTVKGSVMSVADINEDYIETLKLPTAVIGEHGEILMYNRHFNQLFFKSPENLLR